MTLEEIDRRRSYESMFDLMEQEREKHPELADDDNAIYDIVCYRTIPDRIAAQVDRIKESRRDNHA
jgi:hypothetical protein